MKLFSSLRSAGCIRLVLFVLPVLLTGGEGVAAPPGGPLAFRGFSGGMALHTGWVGGGSVRLTTPAGRPLPVQRVRGVPFGIGGSIRFHFGEHLRVGTVPISITAGRAAGSVSAGEVCSSTGSGMPVGSTPLPA